MQTRCVFSHDSTSTGTAAICTCLYAPLRCDKVLFSLTVIVFIIFTPCVALLWPAPPRAAAGAAPPTRAGPARGRARRPPGRAAGSRRPAGHGPSPHTQLTGHRRIKTLSALRYKKMEAKNSPGGNTKNGHVCNHLASMCPWTVTAGYTRASICARHTIS